jgi:hypothetical protein
MATIAVDPTTKEYIASANTLALWHLEDATDSSGLSNTLTNHGTTGFVAGKFRNCADFGTANTTKWFERSDQLGLAVNAQRTYSCWVKIRTNLSGASTYGYGFVSQGYSANKVLWFVMYYRASYVNYIRCGRQRSGVATEENSYICDLGTAWHNIIYTVDATVQNLYYDGAHVATTAAYNTGNGTAATVGGTSVGAVYADGTGMGNMYMDETIVENVAWSDTDVTTYYNLTSSRYFGEYQGAGSSVTGGLYHLNDNANDSSGNNRFGTNYGVLFGNSFGRFGSGGNTFGTVGYIVLPTVDFVPTSSGQPLTISAWVNASSSQGGTNHVVAVFKNGIYLCYDHATTAYRGSVIYGSGGSFYGCGGGTGLLITNAEWHHMLGTYDGTWLRNYTDGKETGTAQNLGAKVRTSANYCCIFCDTDKTSAKFTGSIDDVFIENVAWSATQIKKYYAYTKARFGIV